MDSFLLDGIHVDPWTIYFVWGEMIDKLWDSIAILVYQRVVFIG